MNTNVIYLQKDRSWVVHVAFYIVGAIVVLAVFSYGVFYVRAQMESQTLAALDQKISLYGTAQQKQNEKMVLDEQKKINDFSVLIQNHKLSSNVFRFLEVTTLPGVVFSGFNLSESTNELRLSGDADSMAALAKQFAVFENSSNYIAAISVLNSQTSPAGKASFVFNISLNPAIFTYGQDFSQSPAAPIPSNNANQ